MVKKSEHLKIQPTPVSGFFANGLSYAWEAKEGALLLLDFLYNPLDSPDSYVVTRVHMTSTLAIDLRNAIDHFLRMKNNMNKKSQSSAEGKRLKQASVKIPRPT